MKRVSGFTLIELIMVIVILGVLSAFALPRFADLGGDARLASLNALAGTLRSSSNIAHAQQLADGNSGSSSVTLDGQVVTMASGYPTADAAGVVASAKISDYATSDVAGATITTLQFDLVPAKTNCYARYEAADGSTNITPVVSVVATGC